MQISKNQQRPFLVAMTRRICAINLLKAAKNMTANTTTILWNIIPPKKIIFTILFILVVSTFVVNFVMRGGAFSLNIDVIFQIYFFTLITNSYSGLKDIFLKRNEFVFHIPFTRRKTPGSKPIKCRKYKV